VKQTTKVDLNIKTVCFFMNKASSMVFAIFRF